MDIEPSLVLCGHIERNGVSALAAVHDRRAWFIENAVGSDGRRGGFDRRHDVGGGWNSK